MKPIFRFFALATALAAHASVHAQVSLLRVTCEGNDVGAEVTLNGKFKGECPVDIQAGSGTVKLRVVKKVDATHERVFEQEFRLGTDVVKRIDVVLSELRPKAKSPVQAATVSRSTVTAPPKGNAEVEQLYRLATEKNDPSAQNGLGIRYKSGLWEGIAKDEVEAVRWFRLAAAQNDSAAQVNLGQMYANGRGVTRDDGEAVRLFRLAAAQDSTSAQISLGDMYANGRGGLPKDMNQAKEWYRKSVADRNGQAEKGLAESGGVPVQERVQTQAQASEWPGGAGTAQSAPRAPPVAGATAVSSQANAQNADLTRRMMAAIASGNTNELARAVGELNQPAIAAAPGGSNARAAAAVNRVMAAAASGNVDEMNRALAEMNQALAQGSATASANSAPPIHIPQGVPMQVSGGGNRDAGIAVGSGSSLSGANVDAGKGLIPGTSIRCDPGPCIKPCEKDEERKAGKCVPKTLIVSCLAPARLQNGRCVVPGGGVAGGGGSGGDGGGGGNGDGRDGGGGILAGQDATSCIVIGVNAKRTSQMMTNRCTRKVDVVWCLLPSTVSRKIGVDCGRDKRYFQQFPTLGPGEVYENSYSMRLGETFQFGACFGRTKQGANGTFSCL